MKKWIFTHDRTDLLKTIPNDKSSTMEKVLGVVWNPVQDEPSNHLQEKAKWKNS